MAQVGTDALIFSQFSGAGSATTASGGLTVNGSGDIVLDTPSNVKSILNFINNSDLESFDGSSNIVELGTITSGTWNGTKITDDYINSASTWNSKQNELTFGISDTNSIKINGSANQENDIAVFTDIGIKGLNSVNLKALVGLDNVDNISDLNKPISTAVQNILNTKQNSLTFTNTGLTNDNVVIMNGTANQNDLAVFTTSGIKGSTPNNTKILIGLENVDNTSDLNKPISTVVQTALANKQDKLTDGISNTNNVIMSADTTSGNFAKFTANGLEGRTISEVKSDLAITHSDIDLSLYSGSSSINTTGTITSGVGKVLL